VATGESPVVLITEPTENVAPKVEDLPERENFGESPVEDLPERENFGESPNEAAAQEEPVVVEELSKTGETPDFATTVEESPKLEVKIDESSLTTAEAENNVDKSNGEEAPFFATTVEESPKIEEPPTTEVEIDESPNIFVTEEENTNDDVILAKNGEEEGTNEIYDENIRDRNLVENNGGSGNVKIEEQIEKTEKRENFGENEVENGAPNSELLQNHNIITQNNLEKEGEGEMGQSNDKNGDIEIRPKVEISEESRGKNGEKIYITDEIDNYTNNYNKIEEKIDTERYITTGQNEENTKNFPFEKVNGISTEDCVNRIVGS